MNHRRRTIDARRWRPVGLIVAGWIAGVAHAEAPPTVSTTAVTLAVCFRKAQQISETIGISAQSVRVAEEEYRQSVGAVLPHIDWFKSQELQDTSGNNSGGSAVATSFTKSPIPESYFQLIQPLFSGFRDWKALDVAKSIERQAEWNR
ncbi:MAG TPA: hypothetical protein VMU17_06910, partial [Elusimicrobiota bacterium]|nr:hypothetical protein [Elusimicrobiota bacterium]